MKTNPAAQRYHSLVITLHWVMGVAIFLMLGSGIAMEYLPLPAALKFNMYQWHKSLGVLILLAFFLRLAARFLFKPPALPPSVPLREQKLAKIGHWGLYALMLLMPLSGWLVVSSSVYGLPTIVFGLFEWPHIPGVAGNHEVEEMGETAHLVLAIGLGLLLVAHIGAVVKHARVHGENLLTRMWFS